MSRYTLVYKNRSGGISEMAFEDLKEAHDNCDTLDKLDRPYRLWDNANSANTIERESNLAGRK